MRDYIKKQSRQIDIDSVVLEVEEKFYKRNNGSKKFFAVVTMLLVVPCFLIGFAQKEIKNISLGEEKMVELSIAPTAATSTKRVVLSIPTGVVKANPFLPYRNIEEVQVTKDVPAFDLVEPPEVINENSDAARVMDTIVSGILYDKYSPSAILNIEGNDYLVKKGDIVNNYKVINILEDSVTVKLGANVYKAGIGEILTEGTLKHNDVSNLNNKFGGVR